jgi:hypothetical protein
VRAKPEAGKIIATTLDYPMIMDTFGCTPKFLAENPKAAKALADGYFDAVAMIKADPKKSFEIMGADVKQTASSSRRARPTCAGRTAPPTRSSSPASTRSSARKRPNCCWRPASSRQSRTSPSWPTRAS